jgi:hypothetical protein
MEAFLKQRNQLVADPGRYKELAEEISLGGVGLEGDGIAAQVVSGAVKLMENHGSLILAPEFAKTMATASFPQLRYVTDSNECNPNHWPANYFCGECTDRNDFGICTQYGITVSTHNRIPTQIGSVSRDADSSPWTLGITKEVSAQFKSGEIFEGIPLVGTLSKDMINKAVELLRTIDFKRICVEHALSEQAMMLAMQAATGSAPKVSLDVKDEIMACIKDAIIKVGVIPNKQQFDEAVSSGKLTPELAKRLRRNLSNQLIAGTSGQTTFNYSLTSHVLARRLTKELQDKKATYPNIRIYLSMYGGITPVWVQDPSFVNFVKPPFREPETNLKKIFAKEDDKNPEGDFLGIEGKPKVAFNSVSNVINDATDPFANFDGKAKSNFFAFDPVSESQKLLKDREKYNFFKDIFDGSHNFPPPLHMLPFSEDNKKNLVIRAIDPRYVGDIWRSIQQIKNPYSCNNLALANKWKALNPYGAPEMKRALQVANQLASLGILDAPTKKFLQGATKGVNRILAEYTKNTASFSKLCSTVTGATLGSQAGTVMSSQKMGAVSKAFNVELSDIESAGRRMLTLPRPPKNPGELAMMDQQNMAYSNSDTNPMFKRVGWPVGLFNMAETVSNLTLYEYKEKARGDWGDRIQYLGLDLKKLNAPFVFDYSNACQISDRPDKVAKAEQFVAPANEAKTYIYNTAFNVCPEFSPIGPKTWVFPWGPIGMYVDFAIRLIPGSKGGLKDFDERWY